MDGEGSQGQGVGPWRRGRGQGVGPGRRDRGQGVGRRGQGVLTIPLPSLVAALEEGRNREQDDGVAQL